MEPDRHSIEPLLLADAEEIAAGGNRPFLLDSVDSVWWVADGKVDVFAVFPEDGEDGRPPRSHLATFHAGHLLFGFAPSGQAAPFGTRSAEHDHGARLLAIALPETRLHRVPLDHLKALAREPEHVPALARLVDAWLVALFKGVPRPAAPKLFSTLEAGGEVHLAEDGWVARSHAGVVWVRQLEGVSRLMGSEEFQCETEAGHLPVTDQTWLTSVGEARLSAVATEMLLRSGLLWSDLVQLHQYFLKYLDRQITGSLAEERRRLEQRIERKGAVMQAAYHRLASVVGSISQRQVRVDDTTEPLLAVCRMVAQAQGITVRRPPRESKLDLARICDTSRVRYRLVILRDDWWRHDNGPLVGQQIIDSESGERRPVALLPTSARSYQMVAPGEKPIDVDSTVNDSLDGRAHMLYPPLPERAVGLLDLARYALRGSRRDLLTLLTVGLGGGLLGTLVPVVTGQIFGRVIPGADRSQLLQMTLALIMAAVAGAIFQVVRSFSVLRLSGKLEGLLQAAVWDRLLGLPVAFFRRFTTGDLVNRAMGINAIRELLVGNVTSSILAGTFSLFSFALLFYYSWRLALVATGLVTMLVIVTLVLSILQLRHQRALLDLQGKLESLLFGLLSGIAKLRTSGSEQQAFALWAERFAAQRSRSIAARRVGIAQTVFSSFYSLLTLMTLFAMVGFSTTIELGLPDFLAFNTAFGQFQGAILSIVGVFSNVLAMIPTYERLSPILKEVPEVPPGKIEIGELQGDIELSHITFRYEPDGPTILDDVSIRARPGELIALVGPSGSGKSTCMRLLLAFERPESGSAYFDGQDLHSLNVYSVRRQIGVVLQNGKPMTGDIYSNIVGNSNLPMDAAWKAANMAGLAEDIQAMPMGMHTILSEGARTFSGGQVQRLLIARAIVNRPRVLIFDEATSALDNRTQELVRRSIEGLKATRIVVAHRLSTIRHADRIYVLDRGRVVETGNFEELASAGGLFTELIRRQVA